MRKIVERGKIMENNENQGMILNSMEDLVTNNNQKIFTTIKDRDFLFNLETECDYKLNECVGEKIRVKDILVKEFKKMVDKKDEKGNKVINEETGEIEQIEETTLVTILVDDNKKSYVTKSKIFAMRLRNYLGMYGFDKLYNDGVEIEIIKTKVKNSGNMALSFKLITEE